MSANPNDGAEMEDRRSPSKSLPGTSRPQWASFLGVTRSRIKAFEPEVRRAMQAAETYRVPFRHGSMRERMAIVARYLARENPDLCHDGISLQAFIELIWRMGIRINSKDKSESRNDPSQNSDEQDSEGELASNDEEEYIPPLPRQPPDASSIVQSDSYTPSGPETSRVPPPRPHGDNSYPFDLNLTTITVTDLSLPGNTQIVPLVGLVTPSLPDIQTCSNIELKRLHQWLSENEVFSGELFFEESKHYLWCEIGGVSFAITYQTAFQHTLRWQFHDALQTHPGSAPNARYERRTKVVPVSNTLLQQSQGRLPLRPKHRQPVDNQQHEQVASNNTRSSAKRPQGALQQPSAEIQRSRSSTTETHSLIHVDRTEDANRPSKSRSSRSRAAQPRGKPRPSNRDACKRELQDPQHTQHALDVQQFFRTAGT